MVITHRLITAEQKQARQAEINDGVVKLLEDIEVIEDLIAMFKNEMSRPIPDINRAGYIALFDKCSTEFVSEYRELIDINLTINPYLNTNTCDFDRLDFGIRASELGVWLEVDNETRS